MPARSTMRHRALIERDASAEAEADEWGQSPDPDWQEHIAALSCRAWFAAGRELTGQVNAVVEDRKLICPKGTDIHEGDRVAQITNRRGEPLEGFEGPMRIESCGARQDHLILHLESV